MPLPSSGRRQDGRVTAEALLQAAGEVFAELGPDRATSKEISARAGSSAAAVNYYFGGVTALYDAVLTRAHERVLSWDRLAEISAADTPASEKVRQLIQVNLEAAFGFGPRAWEMRIVSRELMSPSPALQRLHAQQMAPRMRIIDTIVAEIVGLPVDDARVRQAAFCTMTPSLMMLTAPPSMIADISGTTTPSAQEVRRLTDHAAGFALGGLNALRDLWAANARVPRRSAPNRKQPR